VRRYGHAVDFLFVYVMEAHAADEWPLGLLRSTTPQHRNIDERCSAARSFRARHTDRLGKATRASSGSSESLEGGWPGELADLQAVATVRWTVDTMANPFYRAFGAWPEGHVVIGADGTLLLCTEAQDGEGCVAGGEWQAQVERVLNEVCGCTPCADVAAW
jgi:hypothetical protein